MAQVAGLYLSRAILRWLICDGNKNLFPRVCCYGRRAVTTTRTTTTTDIITVRTVTNSCCTTQSMHGSGAVQKNTAEEPKYSDTTWGVQESLAVRDDRIILAKVRVP